MSLDGNCLGAHFVFSEMDGAARVYGLSLFSGKRRAREEDLDEEDECDEADHHEQYCVLQPVFEVARCHLAADKSSEESLDHCHVEEHCCDLIERETDEVETYPSD